MKTIHVKASKSYDVNIGSGLLQDIGKYTAALISPCKVCIISDSHVWPLYGDSVKKSLTDAGYSAAHFVFPAGEQSKCAETYLQILDFLAKEHMTRSDLVIALGGGVVGDITGFSAATFLRGIAFIQVPTSLLAMVDSSVGGKTAIDLPAGKNLVGAFYQPSLVLCDIDTLKTLPSDIFRDGCAEVIKYGVLYDESLFKHLEENTLSFHREDVIARCVELKKNVVGEDEFDTGSRQKLNLGHTLGHGVEAGSNYTISHGQAVAIGMALIARASCKENICPPQVRDRIISVIKSFGLPINTDFTPHTLYHFALSDKKRAGKSVNLILPRSIGDCIISPRAVDTLQSFIEAGF